MTAGAVCDQTDPYQRAGGMAHSVQPLREAILRGSPSNTHMLYMLNAGKMYRQADSTLPSLMAGGALMGLFYYYLFCCLFLRVPKKDMRILIPCWHSLPG